MHSATAAASSSSQAPSDPNMSDAASRASALPPPTVLLEAPLQHQSNSALTLSATTNLPSSTTDSMPALAAAAGHDARNASFAAMSAPNAGFIGVPANGGDFGSNVPVTSAPNSVPLPRMMLPSHYVSQLTSMPSATPGGGRGTGQPSTLGFVPRQPSAIPNASGQAHPTESVPASQPSAAAAQQFFASYRSQAGAAYQHPYQQYQQPSHAQHQSQVQAAVQGGQWVQQGYYQQPQQQYAFTAVPGSALPTSPQLSAISDQPSTTNSGNHMLASPPAAPSSASFGSQSQQQMSIGSPDPVAAGGNMHSAISNSWSQPQPQQSESTTTTAGPPMLLTAAAAADRATHSPPTLSAAKASMDHAAAVAAAAMASMINNANAQHHSMDPQAALPSMMFSSDPSTPPSPMDSLAMAAAAVAAASASAASSNGNSPPSLGTPNNMPARPRATRLRPPQPYPYLITMSLLNSPRRKLTLREIYASIQAQYPHLYGPDGPAGHVQKSSQSWKNTVRFNLSRSGLFMRLDEFDRVDVGRAGTGPGRRSAYWTIAPQWMERIQREGPACVMRLGDARKSRSVNASLMSAAQVPEPEGAVAASAAAAAAAEVGGEPDEEDGSAEDSGRSSGGQQFSQEQEDYQHANHQHVMQQQRPEVSSMPPPSYQPTTSQLDLPHPAVAFPSSLAYQQHQQLQQRPPVMNPVQTPGRVWASPTMQPQPYHPQFVTSPSSSTSSVASLAQTSMPWPPATAPAAAAASGDWHHHPYHQHPPSANASPVMQTATLVAVKHEPGSPYAYAVYQSQPSGQIHQQQVHMAPPPPPPPGSAASQQPLLLPASQQQRQQAHGEQDQQLRPGDVRWLLN